MEFADFLSQSSFFVLENFDGQGLDTHGFGQGLDGFDIIGLGWGTGTFIWGSDCGDRAAEGVIWVGLGQNFLAVIMPVSVTVLGIWVGVVSVFENVAVCPGILIIIDIIPKAVAVCG